MPQARPQAISYRRIDKPYAWDNLGRRHIRGAAIHTTLGGPILTTDEYLRDPNSEGYRRALIDFGCGLDGSILQWNDLDGYRAPWASGPYRNPGGAGTRFVERHGINAINRDLASIETQGLHWDSPFTEPLLEATAIAAAYALAFGELEPEDFPVVRATGQASYFYHRSFCGAAYKPCPGERIEPVERELKARILRKLTSYAAGEPMPSAPLPPPLEYATPVKPPKQETTIARAGEATWWLINDNDPRDAVWVRKDQDAPALRYAFPTAPPTRRPLPAGSWFEAVRLIKVDHARDAFEGNPYYWVSTRGHRIPAAACSTRLKDRVDF